MLILFPTNLCVKSSGFTGGCWIVCVFQTQILNEETVDKHWKQVYLIYLLLNQENEKGKTIDKHENKYMIFFPLNQEN